MDLMFLIIWLGDSSKAKYRQRSPRSQAALRELGCKTGLACACCSGDKYGGAAIVALASKHCIQALYARRYPLCGYLVLQAQGRDGQDRYSIFLYQEGVLVGAVPGSPVLDDPQAPGGYLLLHPVIEEDNTVCDVLLESVPGKGCFSPFAGDYGRYTFVL